MTPESRKKHFWTERAGYKGRESFTGALMSHRVDTQHPPSPQSTQLSLGMVPPDPTPPLSVSASFLLRIPSRRPLLSPCCSCQAPSPGSLVLAPTVVSLLHKRERAPIFLIACLNAFPSLRCCMVPMEHGYGLFQRFQHCRSLAPF